MNSTQRNEGVYSWAKQFLNPQITLDECTSRLMKYLNTMHTRIE